MPNNENRTSQTSKNCISTALKPFEVLSHWYCGPKGTKAGKVARATYGVSTLLMASSILLYCAAGGFIFKEEYSKRHESANYGYDPDWNLKLGSICTFTFALFGYLIATPIIGHKCCGAVKAIYGNRNTAANDIEQPTQSNDGLPSCRAVQCEEVQELMPTNISTTRSHQ